MSRQPTPKVALQSGQFCELTTQITIDNVSYIVHTEGLGKGQTRASSKVFLKGKIVFSRKADYSHLAGEKEIGQKLAEFMDELHKSVIKKFTSSLMKKQIKKSEYFEKAKGLLRKKKGEKALALLQEGLGIYPADPFLLSYYGCLISIVSGKHSEGIQTCRDAIDKLNETVPIGREYFYPIFYLNLGRAYLADGNKREALKNYNYGLKADPDDADLLTEINKLGDRRTPPISFLKRSHPVNRYIGSLLHKVSGTSRTTTSKKRS